MIKLTNILKEIRIKNANIPPFIFPKDESWYVALKTKDSINKIKPELINQGYPKDNLEHELKRYNEKVYLYWDSNHHGQNNGGFFCEPIDDIDAEYADYDYYKLIDLDNLNEIKIRSVNRPDLHTNEGLLDFLNQNLQEFIKHEGVWHQNLDSLKLKLRNGSDNKTEIAWEPWGGINLAYHWLCLKEDLPDGGSDEWTETEFKGVKFWRLT